MPIFIFAGFSLLTWLPLIPSLHADAATLHRSYSITVASGDTVWSIAARQATGASERDALIDRIISTNHLANAQLIAGQRLRIPR